MKSAAIIDIRRNAPRTWEDCLSRFLAWRKAQGAAPRTLEGYNTMICLFFRRFPTAWSATCRECIASFLSQDGIAPTTHNVRLKSLRPFFEFAAREGAFTESPAAEFKYRRGEAPRIVDHDMGDVKRLLDIIGTGTFSTLRDTALLLFSLDSGIRPSEALQLRPSDIDTTLRRAVIRAATAKTRQGRSVYFSEKTAAVVERLIQARPEEWENAVPVFCTTCGAPWNTHAWTTQLRRYAQKAGLKRFSSYDLRHVYAVQYLRAGGNAFLLQRSMGHSTMAMTMQYLALSDDDIRQAHRAASPVAALFPAPRKRMGKL
ncbi:MAG: site-specific integrase [Synergistales bacterium]|nr:site-specific integrase [Synergistales bacterium]